MSSSTLPSDISVEHLAKAFELWEKGYRTSPSHYMTEQECREASVSELSANRAAYFKELLIVAV